MGLLIVSGLSGSGKSVALDLLEDLLQRSDRDYLNSKITRHFTSHLYSFDPIDTHYL